MPICPHAFSQARQGRQGSRDDGLDKASGAQLCNGKYRAARLLDELHSRALDLSWAKIFPVTARPI